jgi:four helix bundle protein
VKEARETHYWLRLLAATELVPQVKIEELLDEANQLVAILTSIIKNTKDKGGRSIVNKEL